MDLRPPFASRMWQLSDKPAEPGAPGRSVQALPVLADVAGLLASRPRAHPPRTAEGRPLPRAPANTLRRENLHLWQHDLQKWCFV